MRFVLLMDGSVNFIEMYKIVRDMRRNCRDVISSSSLGILQESKCVALVFAAR
jgi:hypothetical protein